MFTILPIARSVTITVPTVAFIFGGVSTDYLNSIQRYDGSSRTTDSATLATGNHSSAGTVLNDNAYIFGGSTGTYPAQNTIQKYTGSIRTSELATLAAPSTNSSAVTLSENMYTFGGDYGSTNTCTDIIQKYTGSIRTTESATLLDTMSYAAAAEVNNVACIFGGSKNTNNTVVQFATAQIQKYDGVNRSTDSLSLSIANRYHGASKIFGNAYILGGLYGDIQKYNGTSITTESSTLSTAGLLQPACAPLNGKIYIFGGDIYGKKNTIQVYNGSVRTTDSATLASAITAASAVGMLMGTSTGFA